jgi:nitric oxide reductase subunit B
MQSVNHGTWYARSAEVIHSPWMEWTVWLRIPGDIVFSLGAVGMVIFTVRAVYSIFQQPTDWSSEQVSEPETAELPSA